MKASTFPLFTQKNEPSDAEIVSHKLMIKAGLIRQQSSGQSSTTAMAGSTESEQF